ncbi:pyridoxal phosphate-dependent aminotransferase [Eremococcus coleocola]|uniref:Aminotransferase n=1 Tax=Eremococcus coleocola ACS-139-V-Col8 TaxID=908337 RepID=E4KRE6_9LACT|nr:aminotransferase class I/II-fold pyridoxal phosphate-dependent enzyme [Eremococcus coleocola]EFR30548.1 aminotransferase, class I/II [Eremococcus coleocola ACS-139-V-Col8]
MKRFLNQKIQAIQPSGIRKFFDIANQMENVISLGVGEPDFETPWHIREVGVDTLNNGYTFYTSNAGLLKLREAIAERIERFYGAKYNPQHEVLVTVGGSEAIDLALRATLNAGDEVIIPDPSYVSYLPCVQLADGVPVMLPLKEKNNFKLVPEDLEAVITPKTKILVLSFPNNPTGAIMTRQDLEAIIPVIVKHDLMVITDEIYADLTYGDQSHTSIISFPEMYDRTVYISGFSKAYSMTGWRLGYCAAPEDLLIQMTKIHQFAIMAAPTMSQYAGIEAIKHGDEDIEEMRHSYDQRRKFLLQQMDRLGIPCFEPQGAFYIFPNISQFGLSSEDFAWGLLEAEKVAVVPGTAFGPSGEGFIRISYAYSIKELRLAISRLEKYITNLKANH